MPSEPSHPKCVECEGALTCPNCNDQRPKAEDVYAGWVIMTPFGRWETVEKVVQVDRYGPVRIWTRETGPAFSWRYNRWDRVNGRAPMGRQPGTPEVRIMPGEGRGAIRMYAVAVLDIEHFGWSIPKSPSILVEGGSAGRGSGWWVTNNAGEYNEAGYPAEKWEGLTKAKALSKVRQLARVHAKVLGVKVREVSDR